MTTSTVPQDTTAEQQARAALAKLIADRNLPQPAKVLWWHLGNTGPWLSVRLSSEADARTWAERFGLYLDDEPKIEQQPDGCWKLTRRAVLHPAGAVRLPGTTVDHNIGWSQSNTVPGVYRSNAVPVEHAQVWVLVEHLGDRLKVRRIDDPEDGQTAILPADWLELFAS